MREPGAAWNLAIATVVVVIFLPLLRVPRHDDDRTQWAWLHGLLPTHRAPWDLYSWALPSDNAIGRPAGHVPWWLPDDARVAMFRPLTSLTIWFDDRVLRGNVVAAHLHSMLWLALLAWAAGRFLRRTLRSDSARRVGLLVVLTSAPLVIDLGWLCNRGAILSCALGLLALSSIGDWRESGARRDARHGAAAWGLALAAGEYALAVVPLVLVVAVRSGTPVARRRGVAGALGVVAVSALWFAATRAAGDGFSGADVALDPSAYPLRFLRETPGRVAILLTVWDHSVTVEGAPWIQSAAQMSRALLFVATIVALTDRSRRAAMLACLLAVGSSLVVLSAGLIHVRVLLPTTIACAVGFSILWTTPGGVPGPRRTIVRWHDAVVRLSIGVLLTQQVLATWQYSVRYANGERERNQALFASGRRLERTGHRRFIVVAIGDAEGGVNPARAWASAGITVPIHWVTIGLGEVPVSLVRLNERSFIVRSHSSRPFLPPMPTLASGSRARSVRIADLVLQPRSFRDGAATEVLVDFPGDPETLGWTFVQARGARFEPIAPLAEREARVY